MSRSGKDTKKKMEPYGQHQWTKWVVDPRVAFNLLTKRNTK